VHHCAARMATSHLFPRYVPAAPSAQPLLGAVSFGSPSTNGAAVALAIPMVQLGAPVLEIWPAVAEPQSGEHDGVRFAHDGQLLFGTFAIESANDIDEVTRLAYSAALASARKAGYPNVLRMWNHVGSINVPDDGLERYRRFCAGRYEAFASAGYALAADLPSASAVGMPGRGLITYFIAARNAGMQVENPRQVAAYHYPPEYGPRSPSFSRATVYREQDQGVVYVAGTSSVVGHASVHTGDIRGQVEETIRNLDLIIASSLPGATLKDATAVKTYIRHPRDFAAVAEVLAPALSPACDAMYLEADICRAELLVEIEAVAAR
jgi:chorismate lyase / 3-hydroxybenzoate synthase